MEVDIHDCILVEAKKIVNDYINKCSELGSSTLRVIHGYNSGNTLKKYFSNMDHFKDNPKVLEIYDDPANSGITVFRIKAKARRKKKI